MIIGHDVKVISDPLLIPQWDILPEDTIVLITGKTFSEWESSWDSKVRSLDLVPYVRGSGEPGDYLHSAYWKAFIINEIDVDVYYEDDCRQTAILRNNCPNTLIVDISDEPENTFA